MIIAKKAPAPLLLPVLMWVLGFILGRVLNPAFGVLAGVSALLCLVAILLPRYRLWLVLILLLGLGALRLQLSPGSVTPLSRILAEKQQIQQPIVFRVLSANIGSSNSYSVRLDSLATLPVRENLVFYAQEPLSAGQSYRCLATLVPISRDPVLEFYPKRYSGKAFQLGALEATGAVFTSTWLFRLRNRLLQNLDVKLGESATWAKALLLSDPAAKREHTDILSDSGIMHLVVVSGLHVWFIYLVVVSLLRIILRRNLAELVFLPVIVLFAALNNWAPPISRAVVMIGVGIFARLLSRPLSGGQSLAVALFVITFIDPQQMFNIGLQLSFAAVAVILWGLPKFKLCSDVKLIANPFCKGMEGIKQTLLYSVLISVAISPFTLYYFGRASLNGIIGNLLGIPLIGIMLPVAFLVLLTPQTWYLGRLFALVYHALVALWEAWMSFSFSLPYSIRGTYYSLGSALALGICIVWGFLLLRGRFRLALFSLVPLALFVAALVVVPSVKDKSPEVYVFSSGVSDCALVIDANGKTLMIDTGGVKDFSFTEKTLSEEVWLQDSWMQYKLLPWLDRKRIKKIDYLVLTHLHADHCGGLLALLQDKQVEHIFIGQASQKKAFWKFASSRDYFGKTLVHTISDTCSYVLGEYKLKFLHPDLGYETINENNRSLVFRLDYAKQRILWTGDIEREVEEHLLANYPEELKCDLLKVPHHGSKSSSSEAFITAAQPREAWITSSSRNRFGFPHAEVLQRYRQQNIRLECTSEGTIRKKIDISGTE